MTLLKRLNLVQGSTFITLFFTSILCISLLSFIFSHLSYFIRPFDPIYFGDLYSKSQYVVGAASEGGIGDDGLYAFAGYYYFFQGGDVSAVNFEHPPLGKYLIGLSIFLFRNENIINIIYFITLLFFTYRIARFLQLSPITSILASGILTIDPLFLDHLIRSQLDLPFTLFIVLAIYFYLKSAKRKNYLYVSFLFWGCAFSTRFFPFLAVIYLYLFSITHIFTKKNTSTLFYASFITPFIYVFTHISFFFYHPSVMEFLRHKIWMISWFQGSVFIIGNILRNMFTGTYIDSSGILVINKHWTIIQPVILVSYLLSTFSVIPNLVRDLNKKKMLKRVQNDKLGQAYTALYGICLLYLLYIIFLTNGVAKFIMPIYPLMVILAVSHGERLFYSIMKACRKPKSLL